jgi:hypothetical protein
MDAITIRLYFPSGDPKRLRIGQITNWNGKAVAAPRTEFDLLLDRNELQQAGVYILAGTDESTGRQTAYIGEAEIIRDRLRGHKNKEWVQAFIFVSDGDTLTKGLVRYLEGRLIELAQAAGRAVVQNAQASGSKLPESDRADMEVFLGRIQQLLPVLGSDILVPILQSTEPTAGKGGDDLTCKIRNLVATGRRTASGLVVFQASLSERPSAKARHPYVIALRPRLQADGTLAPNGDHLVFTRDTEFTSPSAAASVVHGGGANGLTAWKREW